jgi:hypothetical protein
MRTKGGKVNGKTGNEANHPQPQSKKITAPNHPQWTWSISHRALPRPANAISSAEGDIPLASNRS